MKFMRLNTLSTELAEKIQSALPQQQRAVAIVACQRALSETSLIYSITEVAFSKLRSGESIADGEKRSLIELGNQLDQDYFDLQDEVANNLPTKMSAVRLFSQARAIAALVYATGDDPCESAVEAVYEAAMAVSDPNDLFDLVITVL